MIIYGRNPVIEAIEQGQAEQLLLAAGITPATEREMMKLARKHDVPVDVVPRIELDRLVKTTQHQGIAARLPEVTFADPDAPMQLARKRGEKLFLILLDQIQDPHNLGAIIRSAEVLGAHGVVMEERRAAPVSAVVVKTSAGATSHIPLVQVKNLPRHIALLKEQGVWFYAADVDGGVDASQLDWDRDIGLVIGSEGSGLRRVVREACDAAVMIPTRGRVQSLNASVAAGILIEKGISSRNG